MLGLFKKLFPEKELPVTKRYNRPRNATKKIDTKPESNTYDSQVLFLTKRRIANSMEFAELKSYFSEEYDYKTIQQSLSKLKKYSPDNFNIILRVKHWDGKIIAQHGTGWSQDSTSLPFESPTGEYSLEFSLTPEKTDDAQYQILWLGLDYAGKTSLIHRFRFNSFSPQMRTFGQDIEDFILEGLRLTTIDLGGQKSLRSYWSKIPMKPDLIIYVIDAYDKKRYQEAILELKTHIIDQERYKDVPLIILLNKIDLLENNDLGEIIISELKLDEILDFRPWVSIPVSAKTSDGLDDVVKKMSTLLLKKHL